MDRFNTNAFNIDTGLMYSLFQIPLNPPFSKGEIALFPSLEKRGQGEIFNINKCVGIR
jgi:hypothetical protein